MVDDDHGEDRGAVFDGQALDGPHDPPARRPGRHHGVEGRRAATPVDRADRALARQDDGGRVHRRRRSRRLGGGDLAGRPPSGASGRDGPRRGPGEPAQWDEARRLLARLWAAIVDRVVAWLRRRVPRVVGGGGQRAPQRRELEPHVMDLAAASSDLAPFPEAAHPGDNLPAMGAPEATSGGLPPSVAPEGTPTGPGSPPVGHAATAADPATARAWAARPGDLATVGDDAGAPGGHGAPERADYLAFLADAERVLDRVDRALARLDDGSYGTCEICAEPIADDDLASDPTASRCAGHLPLAEGA